MSGSKEKQKRQAAQAHRQASRRLPSRRILIAAAVVILALGAAGVVLVTRGSSSATAPGATPQPTPFALGDPGAPSQAAIDGILCDKDEQLAVHIHAHLAVYTDGAEVAVPAGIGIAKPRLGETPDGSHYSTGACLYWLHTHDPDGVIHIEAPSDVKPTLGQFFAIWGQTLDDNHVAAAIGKVTAYVDGKLYTGDPTKIALTDHAVIQLNVGKDVAPAAYAFPTSLP